MQDDIPEMSEAAMAEMFSRKPRKRRPRVAKQMQESKSLVSASGVPLDTYEDMLSNIFNLLTSNNPELVGREGRKRLKPPQMARVGSTRSAWVNFSEIAGSLQRNPEHMLQFFLSELGTTGSIDGSGRMVVRGRIDNKKIESLIRKYVIAYVNCSMCNSWNTDLTRDADSRLYFMSCNACGCQRSVSAIKSGYHAIGRGDRRKARAAAGI